MAKVSAQAQIPWSDNLVALQHAIHNVLSSILTPEHARLILSGECMTNYWIPAFTHRSVAPQPYNYERYEFDGDLRLAAQFNRYLRLRFGTMLSPAQGTYFQNFYMSKNYQAELSRKKKLNMLVRYDPSVEDANVDIEEDVFEAFAGALGSVVDDKIVEGMGNTYVLNFISSIFNEIPLSLDEVERDPPSNLKELFDKKKWGDVRYQVENSDRPDVGPKKIVIRDRQGGVLGIGYGKEAQAKNQAASEALQKLAEQGVTRESADQEQLETKRRQSSAFDEQYRRVEASIKKLNQMAASRGQAQATEFKMNSDGSTKNGSNTLYSFSLNLAYPMADGKVNWKSTISQTGTDQNATRIALMKAFGDQILGVNKSS